MRKSLAAVVVVIAIVVIAVLLLRGNGTSSNNNTPATQPSNTSNTSSNAPQQSNANQPAGTTDKVSIANLAFSPSSITVKKGTTVTWTNNDSVEHTVTGDTNGGPDSSALSPGGTYSFTFNSPGTFAYHCNIHPQMHGTVTVTQ